MYLNYLDSILSSYVFRKRTIFVLSIALLLPIYIGIQSTFAVSTNSGDTITGTIRFDLGTYGSAQDTLTVLSDTVTLTVSGTSTDRTNYLRASGPIASVNKALEGLRLTRTNNAKFKGFYYLRFSSVVTGLNTAPDPTNCDGAISSAKKDITLRPMTLYEVRRKVVPLVNGKT